MSTTSPRSSPLLQLFLSAGNSKCGGGSGETATSSARSKSKTLVDVEASGFGQEVGGDTNSTASSTIMRSLSKCFDGGVTVTCNDDVLREDDVLDKATHSMPNVSSSPKDADAGKDDYYVQQQQLLAGRPNPRGSSHSNNFSEELFRNLKNINIGGSLSNFLFKPINSSNKSISDASPSKTSHTYNSSSTSRTAVPTTSTSSGDRHRHSQLALKTGMSPAPSTPGSTNIASAVTPSSTTAAIGGSASTVANFWNIHALPASACRGTGSGSGKGGTDQSHENASPLSATSLHSVSSPLSSSAKVAADAVMNIISNAENYITTSTGFSLASGGGFCSPRHSQKHDSSLAVMEGIPEGDELVDNENCVNDNVCFEFEEFGFNPFVGNGERGSATKPSSSPSISHDKKQPKKHEIRLKSSFSKAKAIDGMQLTPPTPPVLFGRTHPNHSKQVEPEQRKGDDVSQSMDSRTMSHGLPFSEVSIPTEIERSVSELTMRSHGAFERTRSDSRRMAYYAVGRTTIDDKGCNNKIIGNRRCYFSGTPITYGMVFYAGSVQQGPHTLVVFCLPSTLGLPTQLASLPAANENLLLEMKKRYPTPFDTLPVQIRSPHCWRLFVKFCFFSGLPIAEGDMHFRVKKNVRFFSSTQEKQLDEEIALSHDVMEAVNGEVSAEILRLPNQKVFDYLRLHYTQQSLKLSDEVFDRQNWELVMPEI